MTIASIRFADLPALGAPLDSGEFAGITTQPDGTHCAVVKLPEQGSGLTHGKAVAWAEKLGGVLLVANLKGLEPEWHWLAETHGASYAWDCYFGYGSQSNIRKSYEGSAVAVRLIPLIS
ncbi:hypothetical protein [Alicycliphilus denitrificans]|uniref:hypothetical protein n=1 Tax=Alicycliphilus denitrificans TaxID=179636 RepID=UPI000C9F9171|nr:hypothetical protein [Alicycliphilus denitrificans]